MRILHVNHYYDRLGGAEVYLHTVAEEQARRGHRTALFTSDAEVERDEPGLRVVRRPFFAHDAMIRDDRLVAEFLRFARAFDPEVVHVHKLVALPVELVLALRAVRRPLLHTVYDYSLFCPNGWNVWADGTVCSGGPGRKCFLHGCERNHRYDARVVLSVGLRFRLVRRVMDAFVCPTGHLAGMCTAHGFRNVHTLPYFALPEPATPRPAPPPRDRRRLLCVSRLEREKGVAVLVEAFPLVRARHPEAKLTIVGGGPEEAALRARVRELGLGDDVEFAGSVAHDELRRHLEGAGVLVLPSIWCEALPLVAFDAMAAGLPMVGSAIGGIPMVVRDGETGLLARARDAADLAEKLGRLLSDAPLWERLSRGSRAERARYHLADHLDRLEERYADAIREHARPGRRPRGVPGGERRAVLHRLLLRLFELEGDVERWRSHVEYVESCVADLETGNASQRKELEWLHRNRQALEERIAGMLREQESGRRAHEELAAYAKELERKGGEARRVLGHLLTGRLTRFLAKRRRVPGLEEFLR
jgi:glycosyltransferase involved in cell wall biosynthesis